MTHPNFETNQENNQKNIETLPEYLSAARVSFSYTPSEVSKITGISQTFIQDLEKGAYHRLPAEVYVLGFLRQLADLYGVDSDDLISQYKKEKQIFEKMHKRGGYRESALPKFIITPKVVTLGVLGIFALFVLGYLFYQVHAINKAPQLIIIAPSDNARINTSSVLVQGKTDPGSTVTMNDQQMFVDSSGEFKQPVSISPGQEVLRFSAKNNFGKETTKQIAIIGDFQNQEQLNSSQNAQPLQLTLTVGPNSTVVSVQVDGGAAQDQTFIAGSSKTYSAKTKIIISTGDAGSTSVSLNGKDLGKLGRDGEVLRNIPFTVDNVITN